MAYIQKSKFKTDILGLRVLSEEDFGEITNPEEGMVVVVEDDSTAALPLGTTRDLAKKVKVYSEGVWCDLAIISNGVLTITAPQDTEAAIILQSDENDDRGDGWKIVSADDTNGSTSGGKLTFASNQADSSDPYDLYLEMASFSANSIATDSTAAFAGHVTVGHDLTVEGDLTVNGTNTMVNSTTMTVDDKNIELASVAGVLPTDPATAFTSTTPDTNGPFQAGQTWYNQSPTAISAGSGTLDPRAQSYLAKIKITYETNSGGHPTITAITQGGQYLTVGNDLSFTDAGSTSYTMQPEVAQVGATGYDATADGGGITLKGLTDKTILWTNSTDRWHYNQGIEIDAGNLIVDTGNVGIGDDTPGDKISVVVGDSENIDGLVIDFNETGNYRALYVDSESAYANVMKGKFPLSLIQDLSSGYGLRVHRDVGEAGSNPLVEFIDDNTNNTQTTLKIQQDGTGDILNLFDGATEVFTVLDGGNVGINQAAPGQALDVVGNIELGTNSYMTLSDNQIEVTSGDLDIKATGTDADIAFTVDDNGTPVAAMELRGSAFGSAFFTPLDGGYLKIDDSGTDGNITMYGDGSILRMFQKSDTAADAPTIQFQRYRITSPFFTQDNDLLGELHFQSYDGGDWGDAAKIKAAADGDHGDSGTDTPGRLEFWTTPNASDTPVERMVIKSDGKLGIGVSDPDSKLEVLSTTTQLKLSYDGSNASTFTVASDGDTTWTATDAIVDAGGNIEFNADGGTISFKDDTEPLMTLTDTGLEFDDATTIETRSGNLNLIASGADQNIRFTVDDNGAVIHALTFYGADFGSAMFTPGDGGYLDVSDGGTDGNTRLMGNGAIEIVKISDTPGDAPLVNFRRKRTVAGSDYPQENDYLGQLAFSGWDSTPGYANSAEIAVKADFNHGNNTADVPGRMEFYTTPNNSETPTLRMTIKSDGKIGIGTDDPDELLHIAGNTKIDGNLTVDGTVTAINSTTLTVDDKNIELGKIENFGLTTHISHPLDDGDAFVKVVDASEVQVGATLTKVSGTGAFSASTVVVTNVDTSGNPHVITVTGGNNATDGVILFTVDNTTDTTADGGGITLKATADKTFNWVSATNRWTSNVGMTVIGDFKVGTNGYMELSDNQIGVSSGNLTLDVAGNIELNADSGTIDFKDNTVTLMNLDSAGLGFVNDTIIEMAANGGAQMDLTLKASNANAGKKGNIILDAEGIVEINSDHGQIDFKDNTASLMTLTNAGLEFDDATEIEVTSGDLEIKATGTDADIKFTVDYGGSDVEAFKIDGGSAGSAFFTPLDGGYVEVNDSGTDGSTLIHGDGSISLTRSSGTADDPPTLHFWKTGGNSGSMSAVASGDTLGRIKFSGRDTNIGTAAMIEVLADGEFATGGTDDTDAPGKLRFLTSPDGSDTPVERMTIKSDGKVGIGVASPSTSLQVGGNDALVIPVGTNSNRGTATQGGIRYNTDLSTFEGYDGSAWGSLGGVIDSDQDTYITAEATTDSDKLDFYTNNKQRLQIDSNGRLHHLKTDTSYNLNAFGPAKVWDKSDSLVNFTQSLNPSVWTAQPKWTTQGAPAKLIFDNSTVGGTTLVYMNSYSALAAKASTVYELSVTIASVSGTSKLKLNATSNSISNSDVVFNSGADIANGTHVITFTSRGSLSTAQLELTAETPSAAATFEITDISLREVVSGALLTVTGDLDTVSLTIGSTSITSLDEDMAGGVSASHNSLATAKTTKSYIDTKQTAHQALTDFAGTATSGSGKIVYWSSTNSLSTLNLDDDMSNGVSPNHDSLCTAKTTKAYIDANTGATTLPALTDVDNGVVANTGNKDKVLGVKETAAPVAWSVEWQWTGNGGQPNPPNGWTGNIMFTINSVNYKIMIKNGNSSAFNFGTGTDRQISVSCGTPASNFNRTMADILSDIETAVTHSNGIPSGFTFTKDVGNNKFTISADATGTASSITNTAHNYDSNAATGGADDPTVNVATGTDGSYTMNLLTQSGGSPASQSNHIQTAAMGGTHIDLASGVSLDNVYALNTANQGSKEFRIDHTNQYADNARINIVNASGNDLIIGKKATVSVTFDCNQLGLTGQSSITLASNQQATLLKAGNGSNNTWEFIISSI